MAKTSASRSNVQRRPSAKAAATARPAKTARQDDGKLPVAVTTAVRAALDRKAEDVVVLDLRKAGGFTDHFEICTGGNPRQITAIADSVR